MDSVNKLRVEKSEDSPKGRMEGLMPLRPRIAEISCSRLKFEPGDRILVRVYNKLDRDQERKLRRSIQRWAGTDVEVLIYNAMEMEVAIDKAR